MAISHVANAQGYGASGTALSITHGMSLQNGDVLVAFVHAVSQSTCVSDHSMTKHVETDLGSPTPVSHCWVFSKLITDAGSEPAAYTWTFSSTTPSGILQQFRGVDSTIWDVTPAAGTSAAGTGTSCAAPSITITAAGSMGLVYIAAESGTLPLINAAIDNGYGDLYQITTGRDCHAYRKAGLSAGATGATTCTLNASDDWAIHQVALKPEAAGFSGLTVTRLLQG